MLRRPTAATLWLPVSSPASAYGAVLVTTLLYALTMGRGLGFYDGGELAVAAVDLGLSHPPGQPLYTLVGWVFSHLPWVPPLLGLNALSAVCGGLTVLPVLSLAERMIEPLEPRSATVRVVLPVTVALVAQHAALWEQSTRIEVYALVALLALFCLARLSYLLEASGGPGAWLGLGVVLGACATVNPVLAVFTAICGAVPLLQALLRGNVGIGVLGWLVLGGALGLLPYAYVPFVAGHGERIVWGAPKTWESFVAFVTANDYRANLDISAARWASQAFAWLAFSSDSGLLPIWVIGLTGHVLSPPRGLGRASAPLAALLSFAYLSHYAVFKPELPDCVSYASIATWLCAAGAAALVGTLYARSSRIAALALALTLGVAVAFAPPGPFVRTRQVGDPARTLTRTLLASLPARTVLVVGSDHWVAPLWYAQEAEHQRPDVVVVATGLLSSSWYFEHLFTIHPELVRVPLRGPGGRTGRLARLLEANGGRPIAFEQEDDARALGIVTCAGPVLAHARVDCDEAAKTRTSFTALLGRLAHAIDEGEPTVHGVLCSLGVARARILAAHGHPAEALDALLAPVDGTIAKVAPETRARVAQLGRGQLVEPPWKRETALGDASHNLFLAAQLALAAGDVEHAVVWIMVARDLGLAEASDWLEHAAHK